MVIPADKKRNANIDANKVDNRKTSKTFTVGLYPDGKLPITHYWCCWWVSDSEKNEIKKDFTGTVDNVGTKHSSRVFDSLDGWTPERVLEKMSLKVVQGYI